MNDLRKVENLIEHVLKGKCDENEIENVAVLLSLIAQNDRVRYKKHLRSLIHKV